MLNAQNKGNAPIIFYEHTVCNIQFALIFMLIYPTYFALYSYLNINLFVFLNFTHII